MHEVERAEGAKVALFTFGSFTNPGRTEPSYAFVNTVLRMRRTRKFVCDAYYFKARENDWYLSGIAGSSGFQESCVELQEIASQYASVVLMGNSMGAYAATAFGLQISASAVLAFSAQTRFDADFCNSIDERRWQAEYAAMRDRHPIEQSRLRAMWPDQPSTRVRLFVGADCPQDVAYAADLEGLPGVEITTFAESGHDLVHDLRATGQLEDIIHGELMELDQGR